MLEHSLTPDEGLRLNHAPPTRPQATRFGPVPWTPDDMRAKLEEFAALYERRPIEDTSGGMSSTHCFLLWFVLQRLKPKAVVESGVWQGQATWIIEQACPDATLYCIDHSSKHPRYRSTRANYLDRDFLTHDCGDRYSLKEVMEESGHRAFTGPRAWLSRIRGTLRDRNIPPNSHDAEEIRHIASSYEELPPIFKLTHTRWGDVWDDRIPTPAPLLDSVTRPYEQRFLDEAKWYTWPCYVRLNQ